ncbi:MAG: hypothetical protein ACYTHJ_02355 [Planctomycetota bacterium]
MAPALTGYFVLDHYASPQRIRNLAVAYLQDYTTGTVEIEAAEFDWISGILLKDVYIHEPGALDSDPAVIELPEIQLKHNVWSLLAGNVKLRSVRALSPTLTVIRRTTRNTTNLMGLYKPPSAQEVLEDRDIPSIELKDATITVVEQTGRNRRRIENMMLTVRGIPTPRSQAIDIAWQRDGDSTTSGRARWDLRDGRLRNQRGGLPWLSLEALVTALGPHVNPDTDWERFLGIQGNVRVSDYDLSFSPNPDVPSFVTIELDQAALALPVDDEEWLEEPEDRYLHFTSVNGAVRVQAESLQADFEGLLHGAACRVSAGFDAGMNSSVTLEETGFRIEGTVSGLNLPRNTPDAPEEREFVQSIPRLKRFYRDYAPVGAVDMELIATKHAGADQPLQLERLTLTGKNAEATPRWFPYTVSNLVGTVEFRPDGIHLNDIVGSHGSGIVHATGYLKEAKPWTAATLRITGRQLAIDQDMLAALPPTFHNAMVKLNAEGDLDVICDLQRQGGSSEMRHPWQMHAQVDFGALSACHASFPVWLERVAGTVLIDNSHIEVIGPRTIDGPADISIDGIYVFDKGQRNEFDLDLEGQRVAISDSLVGALPEDWEQAIESLDPHGALDVRARIWQEPDENEINRHAVVELHDVSMKYDAFPVQLTGVSGQLFFDDDIVELVDLRGYHHEATIHAEGYFARDQSPPHMAVDLDTVNLALTDDFIETAPRPLSTVLQDWRIGGVVEASSTLSTKDGGRGLAYPTDIVLTRNTVKHQRFPKAFTAVNGKIRFDENGVDARNIIAKYGTSTVTFRLSYADDRGELSIHAPNVTLDHTVRDMLPEPLRLAWDLRDPAGTVDAHFDRITFETIPGTDQRTWQLSGMLSTDGITLRGNPAIQGAKATTTIEGFLVDRLGGTALSGELDVQSLGLLDLEFDTIASPWIYARLPDGEGQLSLTEVTGEIYDGPINAKLDLRFDDHTSHYALTASAHDIDAAEVINTRSKVRKDSQAQSEFRGRAVGQLYLTGETGNSDSRRGGGHLEIRNGMLYRLPVVVAILNVINLSVPKEEAITDARTDFFIVGDTFQFEDILLRGHGLALIGSGNMQTPGNSLDVRLASVSPHDWMRVPALTKMVENASRSLVEIHIVGPIDGPIVRAKPFSGIRDELKKIFKKKEPRKKKAL